MEFTKYIDTWGWAKRLNLAGVFKNRAEALDWQQELAERAKNAFTWRQSVLERDWGKLGYPYYNVYPAIIPMLLSVKLDIPCSSVQGLSVHPVELRLPLGLKGQGGVTDDPFSWVDAPTGKRHRVESVLFGIQEVSKAVGADELVPGFVIAFDVGERDETGLPIMSFKFFPLRDDMTIWDASYALDKHVSWASGLIVPAEIEQNIVRLCACVALIDNNPDLIRPEVLTADAAKWAAASEDERAKLVERAKKRGKYGWSIGAEVEVIPHMRRPHPALVWTGKGRVTPRIVMRKGSVVHRSKMLEVPSGFESIGEE